MCTHNMFVFSIVRRNELPAKDGNVSGRASDALLTKSKQVSGVCLKIKQ